MNSEYHSSLSRPPLACSIQLDVGPYPPLLHNTQRGGGGVVADPPSAARWTHWHCWRSGGRMGRTRSRRLTRGLSTEQAAAGAPTPAGSPSPPPLHGERRVQIASGSTRGGITIFSACPKYSPCPPHPLWSSSWQGGKLSLQD